ncbi:MAG: heparinase II/III family protein, partial [Campylobacterota bacterium]|nr:heparinase II/III family protein [Campylobacterota bacterium]
GFRVANRASVAELVENIDHIKATHNGYNKIGVLHTREWTFEEDKIIIKDSLNNECNAIARLHFHPDVTESEIKNKIIFNSPFSILNYSYAEEFNKTQKAFVVEIEFNKELKVEISI